MSPFILILYQSPIISVDVFVVLVIEADVSVPVRFLPVLQLFIVLFSQLASSLVDVFLFFDELKDFLHVRYVVSRFVAGEDCRLEGHRVVELVRDPGVDPVAGHDAFFYYELDGFTL